MMAQITQQTSAHLCGQWTKRQLISTYCHHVGLLLLTELIIVLRAALGYLVHSSAPPEYNQLLQSVLSYLVQRVVDPQII